MESALHWIVAVIGGVLFYILASGAAFVSIYRFPDRAPTGLYGWLFKPLDWLARHVPYFGLAYNAFHQWCYRTFAKDDRET
jgi:hypothetical protein